MEIVCSMHYVCENWKGTVRYWRRKAQLSWRMSSTIWSRQLLEFMQPVSILELEYANQLTAGAVDEMTSRP